MMAELSHFSSLPLRNEKNLPEHNVANGKINLFIRGTYETILIYNGKVGDDGKDR